MLQSNSLFECWQVHAAGSSFFIDLGKVFVPGAAGSFFIVLDGVFRLLFGFDIGAAAAAGGVAFRLGEDMIVGGVRVKHIYVGEYRG